MAKYDVMVSADITKPKTGDRIYTYEGYGVKKIGFKTGGGTCKINGMSTTSTYQVVDFPQLGKSLPCVFLITEADTSVNLHLYFIVMEYGGQPDPKYFDIIGLDETGEPIYKEETT